MGFLKLVETFGDVVGDATWDLSDFARDRAALD